MPRHSHRLVGCDPAMLLASQMGSVDNSGWSVGFGGWLDVFGTLAMVSDGFRPGSFDPWGFPARGAPGYPSSKDPRPMPPERASVRRQCFASEFTVRFSAKCVKRREWMGLESLTITYIPSLTTLTIVTCLLEELVNVVNHLPTPCEGLE